MRRSKAPSAMNKGKRFRSQSENRPNSAIELHGSDPEDESFKWGSKDNPDAAEKEYLGKNKRIFNIVWRDATNRKHKTWKGDGTLEINLCSMKAVAKDETGKYMGCTTKFQLGDMQEDYQMTVGGKEIEIQNEIKDEEEVYELRKRQIKNRNWGDEEWISPEMRAQEEKKPKGGFKFKPLLVLNKPEAIQRNETNKRCSQYQKRNTDWNVRPTQSNYDNTPSGSNGEEYQWESKRVASLDGNVIENNRKREITSINSQLNSKKLNYPASTPSPNSFKAQHFMCFIKPSELQQYLFQLIQEYCAANVKPEEFTSIDLLNVLQHICNHPSFIKHSASTNRLVQQLTPSLPHWSEMGPFDSGKLEFVQYFLQDLFVKTGQQNVIIIAKSTNTLNMLQGLCDFMNLTCLRVNDADTEDTTTKTLCDFTNNSEGSERKVLLITTIRNLKHNSIFHERQQIIVFENIHSNMNEIRNIVKLNLITVYYLVTSFSIEEILILPSFQNNPILVNYEELLNIFKLEDSFCYAHKKIKCNCEFDNNNNNADKGEDFAFFRHWQHLFSPFDQNFLKAAGLENSSENIVSIFCKRES